MEPQLGNALQRLQPADTEEAPFVGLKQTAR
jgi:hypothetical protein